MALNALCEGIWAVEEYDVSLRIDEEVSALIQCQLPCNGHDVTLPRQSGLRQSSPRLPDHRSIPRITDPSNYRSSRPHALLTRGSRDRYSWIMPKASAPMTKARFDIPEDRRDAIWRIAQRRTDALRKKTGSPTSVVRPSEIYREAIETYLRTEPEGHETSGQLTVDGALARSQAEAS